MPDVRGGLLSRQDWLEALKRGLLFPARAMMAQPKPLPKSMGLLGDIIEATDPVRAFGGYGNVAAMALPPGAARKPATVRAYHGTDVDVSRFRAPAESGWVPDRALGTHFAEDPTVASKFGSGLYRRKGDMYMHDKQQEPHPGGRVYPVDIDTAGFRTIEQPRYDWYDPKIHEPHQGLLTDQTAIANEMHVEGYKARPDLLERYLIQARRMEPAEAKVAAEKLSSGKTVEIDGKKRDLNDFIRNYGGTSHSAADRAAVVSAAKAAFKKQGIKGFKYINTSPMEMEGVTNPMTYIPLAKGTVRSALTGDILYGGAAAGLGLGGLLSDRER